MSLRGPFWELRQPLLSSRVGTAQLVNGCTRRGDGKMGCGKSHPKVLPSSSLTEPRPLEPKLIEKRAPTPPPRIKATIVFVCGPPAVGKGVQCARICQQFGYMHLSTGDLLRDEVSKGTARGQRVAEPMAAGELVPDQIVIDLLRDAIDSTSGPNRHFVIDGFPSTLAQAAAFERLVGVPAFVLSLEAPDETLWTRASVGDGPAFRARIEAFRRQAQPVLDRYDELGALRRVDGAGSADDVFALGVVRLFEAQVSSHSILWRNPRCSQLSRIHILQRDLEASAMPRTPTPLQRSASAAAADLRAALDDDVPQIQVVFMLGPPAVGKGTQCALLRKSGALSFVHVSTGHLLRTEVAKGSELGVQVAEIMAAGGVVPDDIVLNLLRGVVLASPPGSRLLIDGFPMSLAQATHFEQAFGVVPVGVIALDASESALKARFAERARNSGRDDDNAEAFRRHNEMYREHTHRVLEHYESLGIVRHVDAHRQADEVSIDVRRYLDGKGHFCRCIIALA